MSNAVKNKSKRKVRNAATRKERRVAKSAISWAEDYGEITQHPTKYSVKQLNNRLDFTGLEQKLHQVLGLPVTIAGRMSEEHGGRLKVNLRSENLVEHIGILGCVMEHFYINEWSNNVIQHGNGDYILNVGIHFSWEFKDGGSNGHEIFWCAYNFDRREWSFGNI